MAEWLKISVSHVLLFSIEGLEAPSTHTRVAELTALATFVPIAITACTLIPYNGFHAHIHALWYSMTIISVTVSLLA